jgi:hypothetical protein
MIISSTFSSYWANGFRQEDSSPQKPLGQLQPSFGGIVLGWPPSKIVSGDPNFQPRWENHSMIISSTFSSYWANGFRQEDFYGNFS